MIEKAYAKINLCLDILGKRADSYHEIITLMQQLDLCDDVELEFEPRLDSDKAEIKLSCGNAALPCGEENLAYKAALLMFSEMEQRGKKPCGILKISIEKRIPLAAGLAGGSADAAAVLKGMNKLFDAEFTEEELCKAGEKIGSDVPFCVLGGAAAASGRGTELKSVIPLDAFAVLSKPAVAVSTKEIYDEFDRLFEKAGQAAEDLPKPNVFELIAEMAMERSSRAMPQFAFMPQSAEKEDRIKKNMINVLEAPAISKHPEIAETKDLMKKHTERVLMSGSGPCVYGIFDDEKKARDAFEELKNINAETFICHTVTEKTE